MPAHEDDDDQFYSARESLVQEEEKKPDQFDDQADNQEQSGVLEDSNLNNPGEYRINSQNNKDQLSQINQYNGLFPNLERLGRHNQVNAAAASSIIDIP